MNDQQFDALLAVLGGIKEMLSSIDDSLYVIAINTTRDSIFDDEDDEE